MALLDGGDGTARETRRRLEAAGLLRSGEGSVTIENSSNDPRLMELSMQLLEEQPFSEETIPEVDSHEQ